MTETEQVLDHLPLVDRLVRLFLVKRPPYIDRDAIRGAALEALLKAVRSFDPDRGVPLEAWAFTRISGAMLDELRTTRHGHRNTPAEHVPLEEWDGLDEGTADRACNVIDFRDALANLDRRHRHVLVASLAGVSLLELAAEFGVTDARICQIKKQGLSACRARMAA